MLSSTWISMSQGFMVTSLCLLRCSWCCSLGPSHVEPLLTPCSPTWLNPWWIWFSRLWLQVIDFQLKITTTTPSSPLPPLCPKVPEHSECSVKSTGKARMGLVFHWDIPRRKKPLGQKNLSQIYTFQYIVYFPQHIWVLLLKSGVWLSTLFLTNT